MFERTRKEEFLRGHLIVEGKRAVYISRDSVRLRGGGPEWHNPMVWAMEIERGKIVRTESFFDTQAGVEFLRRHGNGRMAGGAIVDSGGMQR